MSAPDVAEIVLESERDVISALAGNRELEHNYDGTYDISVAFEESFRVYT